MHNDLREKFNNRVILINKPAGKTSFEVINRVKRIIKIKKIGHSGTLDKAAQGLLVVTTGNATKLSRFFLDNDKEYTGTVNLGVVTDSCDTEGEVVSTTAVTDYNQQQIIQIVDEFQGLIEQIPPKYSALKINGKRASDLARAGKDVEIKSRKVEIKTIEAFDFNIEKSSFKIKVHCSKGTYIRSLARDIGEKLGYGAHLSDLIRHKSGIFNLNGGVTLEELEEIVNNSDENEISGDKKFLLSMEDSLVSMNRLVVNESVVKKVLNGAPFRRDDVEEIVEKGSPFFAIFDNKKNIIAIATISLENWQIKYLNVFNN